MQPPSSSSSSLSSTGTSKPPTTWVDEDGTLHEPYRALVLVGNSLLGSFSLDPGAWPSLRYRRSGVAYYCPHCGDVWARLVFSNARQEQQALEAYTVSCEKHPDQWNLAGSLLAGGLIALVHLLPEAVLKRELDLHLKEIEDELRDQ